MTRALPVAPFVALVTAAAIAAGVLASRRAPVAVQPSDEARHLPYELWCFIVERAGQGEAPPPPSVFASWERGYGSEPLMRAIRDVSVNNALTAALVNRVLLRRGEGAYIVVDEFGA